MYYIFTNRFKRLILTTVHIIALHIQYSVDMNSLKIPLSDTCQVSPLRSATFHKDIVNHVLFIEPGAQQDVKIPLLICRQKESQVITRRVKVLPSTLESSVAHTNCSTASNVNNRGYPTKGNVLNSKIIQSSLDSTSGAA